MGRWQIIIGLALTGFFLYQFHTEKFTLDDVLNLVYRTSEVKDENVDEIVSEFATEPVDESATEPATEPAIEPATEPATEPAIEPAAEPIFTTIIPTDTDLSTTDQQLSSFFSDLKTNQPVKTFIVIADNPQFKGRHKIALSKQSIKTDYGILQTDNELIDQLLNSGNANIGTSYSPFYDITAIKQLAPFIKNNFPESKIVPVVVKNFIKDEEMEEFAEFLEGLTRGSLGGSVSYFPSDTFIIATLTVSDALFDSELKTNLFETFDEEAVGGLDSANNQIISLIMNYAELIGAQRSEIQADGIVNFYQGKPMADELPLADRDLHILAFGDMMLGRYVRVLMDLYGKNYIFQNVAGAQTADGADASQAISNEFGQFFKGADIVFANLEGPIKGEGKKGGTAMVFSFNEDIAPFLKNYGFNLFSIANNHAVDQGLSGRDTTIDALNKAGLGWCGHPSEAEDGSVYYGKVLDKNFAFICFQDVTFKLDDEAAVNLIREVRPNVDFLVVSIHWGYEYKHQPDFSTQIEPGRAFIDAGADFIIGHHPHVVQSFEIYKDRFIFYSLGNFVFDQYWSADTQEQLGLGIVMDDGGDGEGEDDRDDYSDGNDGSSDGGGGGDDAGGDSGGDSFKTKVYLIPMKSELSKPRLMTEEEKEDWTERFIGYGGYSEDIKEMIREGVVEW